MSNTRDLIGERKTLAGLISHTLTDYEDSIPTKVGQYKFYYNNGIKNVSLTGLTGSVSNYFCSFCDSLENVVLQAPTSISNYACRYSSGPGKLVFPAATTTNSYTGQSNCRLSTIDISKSVSIVANNFSGAHGLCHLILRSSTLCALSNTSAFTNTGIANGIGWIYVPSDLVDSYKSATNWSTYADQIVPINEYPRDLQNETIVDTWETILASELNGTYSSRYSVGDIKTLKIGDSFIPMQIVGFDKDAGMTTAYITWMSVGFIALKGMNPTNTNAGGWTESKMRTYLQDIVYPQIDPVVRDEIVPAIKTSYDYTTSSTITTTDTVWIPSYREIFGDYYYETSGCDYTDFFTDSTSRIKKYGLSGSASHWWLRSAGNSIASYFGCVYSSGDSGYKNAISTYGVVLGFCT